MYMEVLMCNSGDSSFDAVVAAHKGLIAGECRRALENSGRRALEVGDLIQDAHLAVWAALDTILQARSPRALLRKVVRDAIKDALRGVRNCPEPMEFREVVR
jgi:DNA-directed RNA polymerase specialized sigma24 family protein